MSENRIVTARLVLRPVAREDGDALLPLLDNWNVARWLAVVPWPYTMDVMDDFIAHIAQPRAASRYPIYCVLADGTPIGVAECRGEEHAEKSAEHVSELGYWIGEPYWGRGFATEAVAALIARVFDDPAIPFVRSGVFEGNEASLNVQLKLGFEVQGTTSIMCRPQGRELPLISTRLDRGNFKLPPAQRG